MATQSDLLGRVRQLAQGQAGSRQSIAQLLLSEGSGLARLTMAEVAQLSYTSKPTLVRFAQALGFSGWVDFQEAYVRKARLAEDAADATYTDVNFPFDAKTPYGTLAKQVLALEGHALEQAMLTVDHAALREAARRVVNATQVVCFAVAQNRFYCENLAYRLGQIGIDCLVPSGSEGRLVARGMGPEHCAILVSYSGQGEQRPPSQFLGPLREQGVPCVAITNSGDNWLRHHCDCVLAFPPEERLYSKIAGFYSETATSYLLDLLFSLCFQANYERNVQLKLDAVVGYERMMHSTDVLPG